MPSTRVRPPLPRDRASRASALHVVAGHSDDTEAGFTVIEALVSLVLLVVISAAGVTAIVAATKTSKNSSDRVNAGNLAQQDLQAARALRFPNYPVALAARATRIGTTSYTVTRTVSSACPATPDYNGHPYMTVTSTVTWPPASSTTRVVMATELAC